METGKIEIQFKENTNKLSVHIQLSEDGTVWLTKHQIADLFDVYIQTVTAGLKTIFQKELLLQERVKFPVAYLPQPPILIQFGQTLIW